MDKQWIKVEESLPNTYQTGDWDGKRSDLVLAVNEYEDYILARLYEGFMDGGHFQEWADDKDYTLNHKVLAWMKIPNTDYLPTKKK